jgi:hypothetical protein
MKRLFDKAMRNRHLLRWLGTRPVDDVRAAERRAMSATGPVRARRLRAALLPTGPSR